MITSRQFISSSALHRLRLSRESYLLQPSSFLNSYGCTNRRGKDTSEQRRLFTSISTASRSSKTITTMLLRKERQLLCQRQHKYQQNKKRCFARSSQLKEETPEDKARTFIMSLGHEPEIADGVVNALSSSGLKGGPLLSTVRQLAGRVEVDEDAGLETIIESVKIDLAKKQGKSKIKFYVIPPNSWDENDDENSGSINDNNDVKNKEAEEFGDIDVMMKKKNAFIVEGYEGMSITDVAKFGDGIGSQILGEYIECACSGIMACSTCQIVIDGNDWYDKVSTYSSKLVDAEQDMLDLAYQPTNTSRLGCQVILTKELNGLIIKIPKGSNNMMDFIPFQD